MSVITHSHMSQLSLRPCTQSCKTTVQLEHNAQESAARSAQLRARVTQGLPDLHPPSSFVLVSDAPPCPHRRPTSHELCPHPSPRELLLQGSSRFNYTFSVLAPATCEVQKSVQFSYGATI